MGEGVTYEVDAAGLAGGFHDQLKAGVQFPERDCTLC